MLNKLDILRQKALIFLFIFIRNFVRTPILRTLTIIRTLNYDTFSVCCKESYADLLKKKTKIFQPLFQYDSPVMLDCMHACICRMLKFYAQKVSRTEISDKYILLSNYNLELPKIYFPTHCDNDQIMFQKLNM